MYIFFTLYLLYHLLFPLKRTSALALFILFTKVSFDFLLLFACYIVVPEVFVTHLSFLFFFFNFFF